MKHLRWLFVTALTSCAVALFFSSGTASAHSRYESSTPAKGEILAVGPAEVEVVFSQDIQRVAGKYGLAVNKDRGPDVTNGAPVVSEEDRTRLSVALQPDLLPGRYVVRWNNTSDEDGHPREGAFSFYVNYEPNTVDLANDAELALIGEDATAVATEPAVDTPTAIETPSEPDTPSTEPTPSTGGGDDDSGNVSVILIVVGSIAAAAVVVGGGYWFLRGRT